MNRRPASGGRRAKIGSGKQLWDLLLERHRALCHEWRLAQSLDRADDDLLPARDRVEDALVEVGMAIERAQDGAYGCCRSCGGAIDFQRLLMLPTATRCWPCQQAVEQHERTDDLPCH